MKSIVQEASTISKAVEQAWKNAGNPQEFSVKVLEQPVFNFFGFSKRSAKIALLFDNESKRETPAMRGKQPPRAAYQGSPVQSQQAQQSQQGMQQRRLQPNAQALQRDNRESRDNRDVRDQHRENHPSTPYEQKKAPVSAAVQQRPMARPPEGMWNEELAKSSREWLTEVFQLMGMQDITFRTEIQSFNLLVVLNRPLAEDPVKEKHLLASLSTLLIATLKRQYRKALRGHKVVLSHT
ncbi:TPA: hypothetical protein DDZ86_04720 [Candidatus Dependentiae bacterium]|nr:hypothetical protein [Candidatus Dependentiae bacterium]